MSPSCNWGPVGSQASVFYFRCVCTARAELNMHIVYGIYNTDQRASVSTGDFNLPLREGHPAEKILGVLQTWTVGNRLPPIEIAQYWSRGWQHALQGLKAVIRLRSSRDNLMFVSQCSGECQPRYTILFACCSSPPRAKGTGRDVWAITCQSNDADHIVVHPHGNIVQAIPWDYPHTLLFWLVQNIIPCFVVIVTWWSARARGKSVTPCNIRRPNEGFASDPSCFVFYNEPKQKRPHSSRFGACKYWTWIVGLDSWVSTKM